MSHFRVTLPSVLLDGDMSLVMRIFCRGCCEFKPRSKSSGVGGEASSSLWLFGGELEGVFGILALFSSNLFQNAVDGLIGRFMPRRADSSEATHCTQIRLCNPP